MCVFTYSLPSDVRIKQQNIVLKRKGKSYGSNI